MTDDYKKMLTEEVLGKCWHAWGKVHYGNNDFIDVCVTCRQVADESHTNRTFATWKDLGDLKEKIVEMGEWRTFYRWAYDYAGSNLLNEGYTYEDDFCNWLMNPERFCELVAKWWKERRKG